MKINSKYLESCGKDNDGYFCKFNNVEYKRVYSLWEDKFDCVIHMYPDKDTTDEDGNLLGYDDALFFKIVVYNEDTKEYYVSEGRPLDNLNSWTSELPIAFQIRMFKDGSPMIILGKVEVSQCCGNLVIRK